jgi:hypothetical protein
LSWTATTFLIHLPPRSISRMDVVGRSRPQQLVLVSYDFLCLLHCWLVVTYMSYSSMHHYDYAV